MADHEAAPPTLTAPLADRVVAIARRIAAVLLTHASSASGADVTAAFLRSWADTYQAEAQQPGPVGSELDRLSRRFALTDDDLDLLVLAGLPEEHEGLAATFRALHPLAEPHPTVGLAALLRGGTATDRRVLRSLLTDGPAVRSGLLRTATGGVFPERSLLLPDALWSALQGEDAWPVDLPRVRPVHPPPGLTGWLGSDVVGRTVRALAADEPVVVVVSTEDEAAGLGRCAALADQVGRPVVAARCPATSDPSITQLVVHAALRGALPLLVLPSAAERLPLPLADPPAAGPLLVCAPPGSVRVPTGRPQVLLPVQPVGPDDQRAAWSAAAPQHADQADWLATRHRMDPVHIVEIGHDLTVLGNHLAPRQLSALIRSRAAAILPPGVELVVPDVEWDHLVLPDDGRQQLREAVARLDHRTRVLQEWGLQRRAHAGPGIRLLLCGTPGTGKSLAAHAVATAAGTDLLVVDVSRLVSKWLGETEKNLAAAFDAAERTQAVLVLDEADALFATRTEVSDAHDRYANLETAYLLQRLERFEGLTILTTNLRTNIDPAFIRRLDYLVEFPLPDTAGRLRLWQHHLPEVCRADPVDLPGLSALYPVPGAWIRNACVDAAFAAAADAGLITTEHLVAAMRRGYAKASVPFPGELRRRHVHS